MKYRVLSSKIVEWYEEHRRPLPWRRTRDPYRIWLSEIILQQTRVLQGLPYYKKFIQRYPTVQSLAVATERDVLRLWQGLGYYSRARNLRKCAITVLKDYNGKFPDNFTELKLLPGIGDYTAAAIASFSFGEPVAVLDGNVFRVLSRLFGIHDEISSSVGKKKFTTLANQLVPVDNPGQHNQAMMEFGALHCTPANPLCADCFLKTACIAYANNWQSTLPVKKKPKKASLRHFYYFVVQRKGRFLMSKRPTGDIWTGLYEFPLLEAEGPLSQKQLEKSLTKENQVYFNKINSMKVSSAYKHVLTHQLIHARFVELGLKMKNEQLDKGLFAGSKFYSPRQAAALPKSVLINRYLHETGAL